MQEVTTHITSAKKNTLTLILRQIILFVSGGVTYGVIEILWRGYTHISMVITGGVCFLILLKINRMRFHFSAKCVIGGLTITAIEFVVGCIVNIWLKMDVWDYSDTPLNLMGQTCPQFLLAWCALSCAVYLGVRFLPIMARRVVKKFVRTL